MASTVSTKTLQLALQSLLTSGPMTAQQIACSADISDGSAQCAMHIAGQQQQPLVTRAGRPYIYTITPAGRAFATAIKTHRVEDKPKHAPAQRPAKIKAITPGQHPNLRLCEAIGKAEQAIFEALFDRSDGMSAKEIDAAVIATARFQPRVLRDARAQMMSRGEIANVGPLHAQYPSTRLDQLPVFVLVRRGPGQAAPQAQPPRQSTLQTQATTAKKSTTKKPLQIVPPRCWDHTRPDPRACNPLDASARPPVIRAEAMAAAQIRSVGF